MKRSGFVLFFACGLYLCGAAGAGAAESAPPTYAVMSLIGDSLTIVIVEKGDTGSRLDQNRHVDVPIKENGFDATVLNALAAGVSKLQPEAAQEVLQTRSPALFRLQDRIFENSDAARGVRASLQALFRERNATQLIIVTKHRAEAQIQFANRTSGIGSLEGLGFYVDSSLQLTNAGTQQLGLGLIAPYMYVSLRLVDAKTMEVIRELPVAKALPLERIGTRDFEGNTWDRLGDAQKVRILEFMIRETIKDTLPKLLAPGS